jgi:hypothetical protein
LGDFLFVYLGILKIKVMLELVDKKEIEAQIQKLDSELSIVVNTLMIITGFFLLEIILMSYNVLTLNLINILGLIGLIIVFYLQFKSARIKARILVILENLNKNI